MDGSKVSPADLAAAWKFLEAQFPGLDRQILAAVLLLDTLPDGTTVTIEEPPTKALAQARFIAAAAWRKGEAD